MVEVCHRHKRMAYRFDLGENLKLDLEQLNERAHFSYQISANIKCK